MSNLDLRELCNYGFNFIFDSYDSFINLNHALVFYEFLDDFIGYNELEIIKEYL